MARKVDPVRAFRAEGRQHYKELTERIGEHLPRRELRARVNQYLQGLLQPLDRKNGWQVAEVAGEATPHNVQHLLNRAQWDANDVRDELREYVVAHLGDDKAVLVLDETGFLKKGRYSVGVQRQYSGTAGRIENCQIGVFLAYATPKGRVLLDRELYLPEVWATDNERREAAAVPSDVAFATKPALGRHMIERAVAAEVPFAWVTGDEVYGGDGKLRLWLEANDLSYVLAVRTNQYVWCKKGFTQKTVQQLLTDSPATRWQRLSAGNGAKGPRWYYWTRLALPAAEPTKERWLLVRRCLDDANELAYYLVVCPAHTTLPTLVAVAGRRWAIEECFEATKSETGLDQYEVRNWHGWYRHITLVMAAHDYLTVLRAHHLEPMSRQKNGDIPCAPSSASAGSRAPERSGDPQAALAAGVATSLHRR